VAGRIVQKVETLVRRRICGRKREAKGTFKGSTETAERDMKNLRKSREKKLD